MAVHVHIFLAGWFFTVAMIGVDPLPHRRGYLHRSMVLVVAWAAHDVLAKFVYAQPSVGVTAPAAEAGAMLMYYGGDLVTVIMVVVLCSRWSRFRGRPAPPNRSAARPGRVTPVPGLALADREP